MQLRTKKTTLLTTTALSLVGAALAAQPAASAKVETTAGAPAPLTTAASTPTLIKPVGAGAASGSLYFPMDLAFDAQPQLDVEGTPSGGSGGGDAPGFSSRVGYIDLGSDWATLRIGATWTRYRAWSSGDQTPFAAVWWDDDRDSVNDSGLTETTLNFNTAKGLWTGGSTEPWVRDADLSANPVAPRGRYLVLRSAANMTSRAKEFAMVAAPSVVAGCRPGPLSNGLLRQCIDFPSGVRTKDVAAVDDSFGTTDPPTGTTFADTYSPRAGECSQRTHDRYWVKGSDGHVYRTWHPTRAVDAGTGSACSFGHEHGDDPRTSPLYEWAGGVPFGIANNASGHAGNHRHEDHFGHKVVVQNNWEAIIGNPPDGGPITPTGFRCHWLSKVHQGTHSGDAIGNNEHEYQNNIMCDDGAQRHPDAGWEAYAGPDDHTEASVKVLSVWGQPGSFEACDDARPTAVPGTGRTPPAGSDTKREIKCARSDTGWIWKGRPKQVVSATGDVDYVNDGINELWKPWGNVVSRSGVPVFTSSAYYSVLNPARLYNDGSWLPQRDMDGNGTLDNWIPTLDVCLAHPGYPTCRDIGPFPADVPQSQWWKLPQSPFNGTVRSIHPKGTDLFTQSGKAYYCTDHTGRETQEDPVVSPTGVRSCAVHGQLLQYVAPTRNLWAYRASWGPNRARGQIVGSSVNARDNGTRGSGLTHEWVKFYPDSAIHVPN